MRSAMTNHSEAEVLAAFVDGRLAGQELTDVAEHLQQCEECRAMIGEAVAFEREETKRKRAWVPLAAAAVGIAVFAPGYVRGRAIAKGVDQVLTFPPPDGRITIGRLAGQQPVGAHRTFRGGGNEVQESAKIQLDAAAANLYESAKNDNS